jgi:hypothetical protein
VEIDAGWALAYKASGTYSCIGSGVGPDAGSIQVSVFENNFNETECVISGFPTPAFLIDINPLNSFGLPPLWRSGFDIANSPDCPGPGYCVVLYFPNSVFQNTSFSWETMQTAAPVAMSSAAAKRQQQALHRLAALTRPRHG